MCPLGFKARVGSLIRAWQMHTCSPRFTFCAIPDDPLVASMVAKSFSSTYLQAGNGGAQNQYHATTASQCETTQTLYRLGYQVVITGDLFKPVYLRTYPHQYRYLVVTTETPLASGRYASYRNVILLCIAYGRVPCFLD